MLVMGFFEPVGDVGDENFNFYAPEFFGKYKYSREFFQIPGSSSGSEGNALYESHTLLPQYFPVARV